MKEALLKTKELTKSASKIAWSGTKKASSWSLQKSKNGIGAYKKKAKYKAVEKRKEERQAAEALKRQLEQKKIDLQRQKEAAILYRQKTHAEFLELLSDDFNLLVADVSGFLMSRPLHEQKVIVEKYAGEKSKTQHTPTAQRGDLGMAITLIKPFAAVAFNAAGNALGPVARYNHIVNTISNGYFTVSRPISELHEKELGVLRLFSFFNMHQMIPRDNFEIIKRSIAYNSGSSIVRQTCNIPEFQESEKHMMAVATLNDWLKMSSVSSQQIVQEAIASIGKLRQQAKTEAPELAEIIDKELKGGAGWMNASRL